MSLWSGTYIYPWKNNKSSFSAHSAECKFLSLCFWGSCPASATASSIIPCFISWCTSYNTYFPSPLIKIPSSALITNSSGLKSVILVLSWLPLPWSGCHDKPSEFPIDQPGLWCKLKSKQERNRLASLMMIEFLSCPEILKVLMVCPNLYLVVSSFQKMLPFLQNMYSY